MSTQDGLLVSGRLKRVVLIGVSALLVAAVGLACQPPVPQPTASEQTVPQPGGRLVYGLTLVVSGIDPHVDASSELGIPLTSVYDTLVYQDRDGRLVPGLAEAWEWSEDGLVCTFSLRGGVTFHDGTHFDAVAVQVNLDRIANPETKSRKAASLLGPYERSEVVDPLTVRVHFSRPHPAFLDAASQVYLGMASPTALQTWGEAYQEHQVGTGPFRFKEYVPRNHLLLERNPDYAWAPAVYENQGTAYLEEIEFRFFADPASRVLALESGQAHVMGEIPPQDAQRLEESQAFAVVRVPIPGQPLQFFINTEREPTDDLRVRQALLQAIDQAAIAKTIFRGSSPPAYGPLAAATWSYSEDVEQMYANDPDQARALLDAAGWVDADGDGLRERDGQPLRLDTIVMTWGYLPEVGQMLQAQFKDVGAELVLQEMAFPSAVGAAAKGSYNLAPMVFSASDPSILGSTYHSTNADGGFNWSKVRDAELDGLLEAGAVEIDVDARAKIYGELQMKIMEQALVLPIRDYVNLNGASSSVGDLGYDRTGWFPWLHDVYLMGLSG